MFDRPPRIPWVRGVVVQGGEYAAGLVAQARDDIEAHARPPDLGMRREPGRRAAPKARLLSGVDGFGRRPVASERARARAPSGLHFDEDERSTLARDQVDLDPTGSDVACDDLIPSRFEMTRGALLPLAPEGSPSSGHTGIGLLDRDPSIGVGAG